MCVRERARARRDKRETGEDREIFEIMIDNVACIHSSGDRQPNKMN